MILTLTDGCK